MRRVVVIKTGSTLPSLASRKGDFEDWILRGMGVPRDQALVVDVCNGAPLPGLEETSGVVITGSHSMVTEHPVWSERTAEWFVKTAKGQVPVLGICYGHQLIAHALGGKVGDNPNGLEYGTVTAYLNRNAGKDRLLGNLPSRIKVHVSHTQSVLKLPAHAVLLALSDLEPHQAFVIDDSVWGLQFHPEFDDEIVHEYIKNNRQALIAQGKDPDVLTENSHDTPLGQVILRRFTEIIHRSLRD